MLQALIRTLTELVDSKKAAYSFLATIGASVLHLYFGVSVQDAMLLVSPLGLATVAQAHVDAKAAGNTDTSTTTTTVPAPPPAAPTLPVEPATPAVAPTPQS